jgi:murein DD-endopeptidase MepM/ murein hydrolase activator NlpD
MTQMLRDMRSSGSWDDEDADKDSLGAESMFETLDGEVARHLAQVQGLGLSKELLAQFDRLHLTDETRPAVSMGAQPTIGAQTPAETRGANPSGLPGEPEGLAPRSNVSRPAAVTSDFGWRNNPVTGASQFHRGVDLRAAYGQDVQAAGYGRVVVSGDQGTYGTTIVIEHQDGTRSRYAHLSVALVEEGAQVVPGQLIGRVGNSGRSTAPHLHFEVTDAEGRALDPKVAGNLGNFGH